MNEDATPLYQAVIGLDNQDYYLSYFRRADARGYAPVSWHWPALFIGFFWLLYRRQYQWALIYMSVSVGALLTASVFYAMGAGSIVTPLYYAAMILFQAVYMPLHANAIYYRWVRNEVAAARARYPGQSRQQLEHLESRGGVFKSLPLVVVGILTLLMMLSAPFTQMPE